MWFLLACGSAFFAGITAVLAKQGVRTTDSTLATAIRTVVVLVGAWGVVLLVGSHRSLGEVSARSLFFLVLSGLATGASWLCYFKALQMGEVSKVAPIDRLSTVLTVLLAVVLLGERLTAVGGLGVLLITAGILLMLDRQDVAALPAAVARGGSWLGWAVAAAVFAALTAILGKIGIVGVESNLGTAIRTCVVLVMAWVMVALTGAHRTVGPLGRRPGRTAGRGAGSVGGAGGEPGTEDTGGAGGPGGAGHTVWIVPRDELVPIIASGLATGASWLCYYRALQEGPASVVVPVDRLSVLVTVAFSVLVLRERLTLRYLAGLGLLVAGTLAMLG